MTLTAQAGVENDAFRDPRGSGAHEWWYFDAIDGSGVALVVIFFRGIPFSGQRQRHRDRPADDFPAVALSLYGPDRTELYCVNLHEKVQIGADRMSITIGPNSAAYRDGRYTIEIEDELLDGRRIRMRAEFEPSEAPSSGGQTILSVRTGRIACPPLDGASHLWVLAAPRCVVSATFEVDGTSRKFTGTGYHDHNIGNRSLQDQFRHWRWGRAHFTDETFVFYEADGVSKFDQTITDESMTRNIYLLRYAKTLRIDTPNGSYRIEQTRIVDNGPFYLRLLSQFTNPRGETVTGFSEVLRPAALNWKWFWPLLNSRVRPHRSGDRIGRKITQWLIQRGF